MVMRNVLSPAAARPGPPVALLRLGRGLALAGVVAPLLLIGGMKFTAVEIAALKPLISGAPVRGSTRISYPSACSFSARKAR